MIRTREFLGKWAGWLTTAGIMLAIVAWGMLIYAVVGDSPRRWNYVTMPDVPSESYLSTEHPARGTVPAQIEPPPRANIQVRPYGGRP